MLGRAAYQNPELLIGVDPELFGEPAPVADGFEAIEAFMPVIARGLERGERLHDYTRHLHGLFAGRPGARGYPAGSGDRGGEARRRARGLARRRVARGATARARSRCGRRVAPALTSPP